MESVYQIHRVGPVSSDEFALDHPIWSQADELEISHFHPRSSEHRPRTRGRVLFDGANLLARFEVDDRYVISRSTQFQDMVCLDSCVEFFFQPLPQLGHFNFEINCGGTFLMYYVEDPTRTPRGLAKYTPLDAGLAEAITIRHSMPAVVLPERQEPTTWSVAARIPLSVVEPFIGQHQYLASNQWRGNFYKCADHSSHPHWASWSPLGEALNFHDRAHFGALQFKS